MRTNDVTIEIPGDWDYASWAEARILSGAPLAYTDAPPVSTTSRASAESHQWHSTDGAGFDDAAPVRPQLWQTCAALEAVARCRSWGLRFPRFKICFVIPTREQRLLGLTTLSVQGGEFSIDVKLHARIHPSRLPWTAAHECFHVSCHIASGRRLPRDTMEEEADAFVSKVFGVPTHQLGRDPAVMPRGW